MHENEPSPSNQPEHITSEQIPHSGIHHGERPVDEFDNTSLPEAVERGLVNPTPDTLAGLEPTDPTEKKSHNKLLIAGAAFLAGAAVVAGSVMGIKAAGDAPKNTPPAPNPKATSQTPESKPTAPAPEQLTVASLEIPAALTPEQLGTTFISRLSDWDMAGATAANRDASFAEGSNADATAYATHLAEINGNVYAEALFGADWQSRTDVNSDQHRYIANKKIANADVIELWFKTSTGALSEDLEPFKNWDTVDSVTVASRGANSVGMDILVTSRNNADKNRAEALAPGTAIQNGEKFVGRVTFTTVKGVEKASAFDIVKP